MASVPDDLRIAPRVAVRLSGTGGQGLLLAGKVLAEAAAIHDGLNVVQTNSYGPEARGGASRSELVISRGEVDDIRCRRFDILVCLSQKACDAYHSSLSENGLFIVDSTNVQVVPTSRAIEVPMTQMAVEECGNVLVTNMISLGAVCGCSAIVTFEALAAALESTMRPDLVAVNRKAVELGYNTAQQLMVGISPRQRKRFRNFGFLRSNGSTPQAAASTA